MNPQIIKNENLESAELTELCFTANEANSTVELTVKGTPSIANTAYSRDRITWTTFTPSTTAGTNTIILTNIGDKVYFRNNITDTFGGTGNGMKFVMSGGISASGNVNSMYVADDFNTLDSLVYTFCYANLFNGCTALTTSPLLPAITLSPGCYNKMFYGCTSLTSMPVLPATVLVTNCYSAMFQNCTSLTTVAALPATALATAVGCNNMFNGCTSLQVSDTQTAEAQYAWYIPYGIFVNGTTTARNQTRMFTSCLGTRSSDNMSGAEGDSHIYYTQNPPVEIEPNIYYGYNTSTDTLYISHIQTTNSNTAGRHYTIKQYYQTTKYIVIENDLQLKSYDTLFSGFTALISVSGFNNLDLNNKTAQFMFAGCTSLTSAPALPATTLADSCYDYMFYNCTSLTTPPALPATELSEGCYQNMFKGCTALQVSDTRTDDAPYPWISPLFGDFRATSTQTGTFTNCLGTRSSDDFVANDGDSRYAIYYTQNKPISTASYHIITPSFTDNLLVSDWDSVPRTVADNGAITFLFYDYPTAQGYAPSKITIEGITVYQNVSTVIPNKCAVLYKWKYDDVYYVTFSNVTDDISFSVAGEEKQYLAVSRQGESPDTTYYLVYDVNNKRYCTYAGCVIKRNSSVPMDICSSNFNSEKYQIQLYNFSDELIYVSAETSYSNLSDYILSEGETPTAYWKPELYPFLGYTITYETNGGTAVPQATGQTALPNPLPTTTKTGYAFDGWYTDSTLTTPAVAGASISQNTTLYAKWRSLLPQQGTLVLNNITSDITFNITGK